MQNHPELLRRRHACRPWTAATPPGRHRGSGGKTLLGALTTAVLTMAAVTTAVLTMAVLTVIAGCGESEPAVPSLLLEERARELGLDFRHFNGMVGSYYFGEVVGSGVALADFDNDGDLDVYLVQGAFLRPEDGPESAVYPPPTDEPPRDRLWLNQSSGEAAPEGAPAGPQPVGPQPVGPHFVDVTSSVGLVATGYGMGVATGDYDGDGWVDLYVTNLGSNQLWRNLGTGPDGMVRFRDVTAESGTDDPRWSTSAAFVDLDRDGLLDLWVVNYVDFRVSNNEPCFNPLGEREYCGPQSYLPVTDRLLRNRGDGSFEDVSAEVGLLSLPGPGLGLVTADFDGDGWTDVYVANDQAQNHLWINRSNEHGALALAEEALLRGAALDAQGRAQASMGVDTADIDRDGDLDLFMTHLLNEVNTLYLNDGEGSFADRTTAGGLASASIGYTGFGAGFFDLENDGWLDVVVVNGEVRTLADQREAGSPFPLAQPNQLFGNNDGRFEEVSVEEISEGAPGLREPWVSRGAALGDLDNDGDTDLVVTNNSGPVQVFLNRAADGSHWLGLRLETSAGAPALGATAEVSLGDGTILRRRVRTDASFLSAHDPRLLFGLGQGAANRPVRVTVHWPDGGEQTLEGLELGRYHAVRAPRPVSAPGQGVVR